MDFTDRIIIQWIQFAKYRVDADDRFHLTRGGVSQTVSSGDDSILIDQYTRTTPTMTRIGEERDHPGPEEANRSACSFEESGDLPSVPDRIVSTFDFSHHCFMFIVNGRFIVGSIATAPGGHQLVR